MATIEDDIEELRARLEALEQRAGKKAPAEFSPAPLRASGQYVVDESQVVVATCNITTIPNGVGVANARLYAEAPRMFAVLKELIEENNWDCDEVEEIIKRVGGQA